jgi:UDP-2-acetamido-3-amino-2,3-dideoxy-glucuronate N-acetyltransferase
MNNHPANIHAKSDVQSSKIGAGTVIWQFTVILPGATIGGSCNINSHCFIENEVFIGNEVTIKCGVYIWDGITIEDNAFIGPNVTFINDRFPRSKQKFNLLRTLIKRGASIGANSTILPGITVGAYSLIGAGSVVTRDIPDNTIWIGNPARQTGYVCNCGQKLDTKLHCKQCNTDYMVENGSLQEIGAATKL